jgi:Mg2+-importing ATPase
MLGRSLAQSLLFSVALAVGLSPELLPAILSVNLARGAQGMARRGVLVKRLNAIENLGSMDVLCTDKTGTLTEGVIRLDGAYDPQGRRSQAILELASWNAGLQTGAPNPLDEAILNAKPRNLAVVEKLAEIPFDFVRKRVGVVVRRNSGVLLIVKGAFSQVLDDCSRVGGVVLTADRRQELMRRFQQWSLQGNRVLAVAVRNVGDQDNYSRSDERDLDFAGFLTFLDAAKPDVPQAIVDLKRLGVTIKLITGDAKVVAQHVASSVGLLTDGVVTGKELDELHGDALRHCAEHTDLFVEIDPHQKERIILALKKAGHVVGFLGDGVNDAAAMHAADASLSVDSATDIAKDAADFVLLERSLDVIRQGIEAGRMTFANTLKYILITMSANLGNMVSMAVASLFLPFSPLLPSQILLNNFLSDIPALGLSGDSVDPELIDRPRRWNVRLIGQFMVQFGLLSSLFDAMTFAALLGLFAASPDLFRTGWFVESLMTELVVALIIRTRRPFYQSRPGRLLLWSTLAVAAAAIAIPYAPFASALGFEPLSVIVALTVLGITGLYVVVVEVFKRRLLTSLA